jgi:NTP pyrophosphatase (non-canonical NTP hydrolase)
VKEVTSDSSNDLEVLINRLRELNQTVNISLLMTGGIGLASEGGEFDEIIKKCVFQGKPLNEETIFHMKRELGDIAWYWVNACRAIGVDPNEVIAENVRKLEARYPGGQFDVYYSENRKEGDL